MTDNEVDPSIIASDTKIEVTGVTSTTKVDSNQTPKSPINEVKDTIVTATTETETLPISPTKEATKLSLSEDEIQKILALLPQDENLGNVREYLNTVKTTEHILALAKSYPSAISTETLKAVLNNDTENVTVWTELLKRGNTADVVNAIRNLTPAAQMSLNPSIYDYLRGIGINLDKPDKEYQDALNDYSEINLEDFVKNTEYSNNVGVNEDLRKIVFHGTLAQNLESLKKGFYSVSKSYKVFAKNIEAAITFKTGISLSTVSDGTVTLWNPDSEMLGKVDSPLKTISNPIPNGFILPEGLPKPKNIGIKKLEYTQYIPPEKFIGHIKFSENQIKYIVKVSKRLQNLSEEKVLPPTLNDLLTDFVNLFPEELAITIEEKSKSLDQQALKKAMFVFMYEARLQRFASSCVTNPTIENIHIFKNFPTFSEKALEEYKNSKLVLLEKVLEEKGKLDKLLKQ